MQDITEDIIDDLTFQIKLKSMYLPRTVGYNVTGKHEILMYIIPHCMSLALFANESLLHYNVQV